MSIRLNLYVEKILSRMVIDDAQRVEVEREIRNHLEETVAEGQSHGLTLDQAEEEAMRLFGQPSIVARHFKMDGGIWWAISERLGLAVFIFLILRVFTGTGGEIPPPWQYFWFLIIALYMVLSLYFPRIEVNGGLRIRRFLRPAMSIPFGSIKGIVFQKGHLFGVRNIEIIHDGGKCLINPRMRGFRACALAVDALVGDTLDDQVRQYLQKESVRIRIEKLPYKVTMTITWLAIAALLLLHFRPFWVAEGLPWAMLAGGLLAIPLAIFQAMHHADRSKAGIAYLLAAGFLFLTIGAFAEIVVVGNASATRYVTVGYGLCLPASLLVLWWMGKRLPLLMSVFLIPVLCLTIPRLMPQIGNSPETILAISSSGWFQARWLPNGSFAWILRKGEPDGSESAAVQYYDSIEDQGKEIPLPKKISPFDSYLFPGRQQDRLAVLLNTDNSDKNNPRSGIYRLDSKYKWNPLGMEFVGIPFICINSNASGFWSPDDRYLATFFRREDKNGKWRSRVVAVDTITGKKTDLDYISWLSGIRWLDHHRFAFVQQESTSRTLSNRAIEWQVTLHLKEADASTGEIKTKGSIAMKPNEQPFYLSGGQYALVMPNLPFGEARKGDFKEVIDTRSVRRISVPEADTTDSCWGWDPEKQLLVYPAVRNNKESRLIFADLKTNRIRMKRFAGDYRFSGFRISPDGTKVFYNRRRQDKAFVSFLGSGAPFREIWDLRDDQLYFVHSMGAIAGILESISQISGSRGYSDLPQWSPDSKRIACMTYIRPYGSGGRKRTGGYGLSIFRVGR